MTAPKTGSEERIGIQAASERLGLSTSFLNWALDSGLLKGHRDKAGNWSLDLGDLDQAAAVLHREAPVMAKTAENSLRQTQAPEPEWPAPAMEPQDLPPPAAIPEIPSPAAKPAGAALQPPVPPAAADSDARSKLDAVFEDQIGYLRRQLTDREGAIGQKDALILQLTDRIGQLGETAIGRLLPPGPPAQAAPPAPPPPVSSTPQSSTAEITAEQQAINERQDEALANIRETLLMVRNYLAQLAPEEDQ